MILLDLIERGECGRVAEVYYSMHPGEYKWLRSRKLRAYGWSQRVLKNGEWEWVHLGHEPYALMLSVSDTMQSLVRPLMRDSCTWSSIAELTPRERIVHAAYKRFGSAAYMRRVVTELRALYEDS